MARDDEEPSVDARVNRSVRRFLKIVVLVLGVLVASAGWAYTGFPGAEYLGFYQLKPGQSAIILRLGAYSRTEPQAGLRWHFPTPFETHDIVNVSEIMRLEFGIRSEDSAAQEDVIRESSMQTGDNSIIDLGFVMQYRMSDAFESRYGVAEIVSTLRDAAQAAVQRGRRNDDRGRCDHRAAGEVEIESERLLQDIVDSYAMESKSWRSSCNRFSRRKKCARRLTTWWPQRRTRIWRSIRRRATRTRCFRAPAPKRSS